MMPKWIACGWYVIGKERREFWESWPTVHDSLGYPAALQMVANLNIGGRKICQYERY
jgi:hypothetical protein